MHVYYPFHSHFFLSLLFNASLRFVLYKFSSKPIAYYSIRHASNIWLNILAWRCQAKADDFLGPVQFGFKKGCERSLNNNKKVFEEALAAINWAELVAILEFCWKDGNLTKNLYINPKRFRCLMIHCRTHVVSEEQCDKLVHFTHAPTE